ncbi:chromate efflux transporter [Fulvivirga sp.]|uniref:chromate efflux transporter n=1 Tax=Fulvivirga sp. TaxID=1931237 RepID=UPI0032EE704B
MNYEKKSKPTLLYLFKTFVIIGISSFGGFSALVAVVINKMVERDKQISEDVIMNGFSLASVLPGPVAVNTVAYIGYYLRGWRGGLLAIFSVILPSFILVVIATHFYLEYGDLPQVRSIIQGVIPVIIAVIISVAYNMSRKSVTSGKHFLILLAGLIIQFFYSGYLVFILCLLGSALVGLLFFKSEEEINETETQRHKADWAPLLLGVAFIISLGVSILTPYNLNLKIFEVFSKISLTLFGGGYVMVPILQDIIVEQMNWLTNIQFVDAIAIGQVTPGPILISAAFVGYKVNGILGALIATLGIFGPSSILMIVLSGGLRKFSTNTRWLSMLQAIKPMVISFILYSVWVIGQNLDGYLFSIFIIAVSLIALLKFNLNFLYLIFGFGVLGFFFLG